MAVPPCRRHRSCRRRRRCRQRLCASLPTFARTLPRRFPPPSGRDRARGQGQPLSAWPVRAGSVRVAHPLWPGSGPPLASLGGKQKRRGACFTESQTAGACARGRRVCSAGLVSSGQPPPPRACARQGVQRGAQEQAIGAVLGSIVWQTGQTREPFRSAFKKADLTRGATFFVTCRAQAGGKRPQQGFRGRTCLGKASVRPSQRRWRGQGCVWGSHGKWRSAREAWTLATRWAKSWQPRRGPVETRRPLRGPTGQPPRAAAPRGARRGEGLGGLSPRVAGAQLSSPPQLPPSSAYPSPSASLSKASGTPSPS